MQYILAFIVGGLICVLGQIFLDNTTYLPGHLLVLLVILGSVMTGLGLYKPLIDLAGAGATVPVSNFGYVLTKGVLDAVKQDGFMGLFKGVLTVASAGISAAVIFGFFSALIFKPRD